MINPSQALNLSTFQMTVAVYKKKALKNKQIRGCIFGLQNINKANPTPLLAKPGCEKKTQVRLKAQPILSPEEFVNP